MRHEAATPAIRLDLTYGTRDGSDAADHDVPYKFGRRPTAAVPYPFSTRQYIRLLILRSRMHADGLASEDCDNAHPLLFLNNEVWLGSESDLLTARA
jgi:hypothetical protein